MSDEYRPVPKPPLSNPMAEAMAEDAAERIAAEARAQRVASIIETSPVVEEAPPAPIVQPAPAAVEAAAEGDPPVPPNVDPAAPPRGNEKAFLARIARLADDKKALTAQHAEMTRQNAAMRELLASQGHTPPADGSPPPQAAPPPQQPQTYTQADVDSRAREIADWNTYNQQANDLDGIGKEKFGTWADSMANLNAAGIVGHPIERQIVEAALATGAAPDVINHLGQNLDEAVRISSLPAARMGVELATLAAKLSKKAPAISAAPAPIGSSSVRGGTVAEPDLAKLAEGPMAAYVEARKKAGDPWANGRRGARAPTDT